MLFIHLSREKIILQGPGFVEELVYLDIERKLPPLLISVIQTHAIKDIWVLNGPGSFTTLRLGCLALQTISQFGEKPLHIYSCTKMDIYAYAINAGMLPTTGVIFIGQRKNMWLSLWKENQRDNSIIHKDTVPDLTGEYFIDPCEHILVDSLDRENMVDLHHDAQASVHLLYKNRSLVISREDLDLQPLERLDPQYLIDPQIG